MITVNDLRAYGQQLKAAVSAINYEQTVVDDSQLVNQLDQISPDDNHLFFLVIPSYNNQGIDGAYTRTNRLMFLVLKKCDRSIPHNEFLDVLNETQDTVSEIEKIMYEDHEKCNKLMQWLDVSSVQIEPVWGFASCHGWTIEFSVRTTLF